jgi:hypothetical protein
MESEGGRDEGEYKYRIKSNMPADIHAGILSASCFKRL